jgi:hypothetical protein
VKRALLLLVVVVGIACDRRDTNVRTVALPEVPFELPDGPGKPLVVASCQTCHSARYIADQPPFTRKQWTATVDKMIKTYGAPIDPDVATTVVDYLTATHAQ